MSYQAMNQRAGLAALVTGLGLLLAAPAEAGPRDRAAPGPGREIHITVRAKRLVIPPPIIEQVGLGETRIQFQRTGKGHGMAFTMAQVGGRYTITSVETLD